MIAVFTLLVALSITLIIDRLDELDARKADRAGAAARRAAVIEQKQVVEEQDREVEGESKEGEPIEEEVV
jgi:hypothetical protein